MNRKWIFIYFLVFLTASVSWAKTNSANQLYDQGEAAYQQRQYYKALEYFRKALKKNPYYKEANIGLGKAYFQLENYNKALSYFKATEEKYKNDVDIKLWLAKTQIRRKMYSSGESYLLKALQIQPKNSEAYVVYGDIFFHQINYRKAISYYEQALQINPKETMALLKTGKCFLMLKKPDTALQYFQKAENIDNKSPLTNYYIGEYYYKVQDYQTSEEYLKTALLVSPNFQPAMDILYQVLIESDKWEEAKDLLEKLHSMEKDEKKYYYNLALSYEKIAMPAKSIDILIDAMNIDYGDESLRFLAEYIYHKYYWTNQKVRNRGQILAEFWYKRGLNYLQQNLPNYAIFSFRRGIRLNPSFWQMRLALANIYKSKGLTNVYYNELKVIKVLNPNDQNIDDEIRFTERAMARLLSRIEGINQYDEPETKPKIALLTFKKNNDFDHHYGIHLFVREALYTALKMKHRLSIIMPEEKVNFKTEEQVARDQGADFYIRGEVSETDSDITVKLTVINLIDGEVYKNYTITQRGTHRLLSSVMQLANDIEKSFPVFGQIIRKNHKELFLNVGSRHGFKKGQRFYVIKSKQILKDLLSQKGLVNIVSNRNQLNRFLLAYVRNRQFGVEELEILQVDENIAKARLVTSDFFDEVNIKNYVILKP